MSSSAPPQPARYIGRFAPTPSGYLHFGSLIAALASYLDARSVGGLWLLRMEDIDPPREMPGAQRTIVETLQSYGFEWDGDMLRQSERHAAYRDAIERLLDEGLAYACTCSRKQLEGYPGPYPGFCRAAGRSLEDAAIRLRVPDREYVFIDRVQGEFRQHLGREVGDFVIRRRDGLIAYQLAVVLDDAWQGVTDVVRGADLLDSTPRQIYLQRLLGYAEPRYAHLPVAVNVVGEKLSKQTLARAIDTAVPVPLLNTVLEFLGQSVVADCAPDDTAAFWSQAIAGWRIDRVPRQRTLPAPAA